MYSSKMIKKMQIQIATINDTSLLVGLKKYYLTIEWLGFIKSKRQVEPLSLCWL